jgi:hypothetical protein
MDNTDAGASHRRNEVPEGFIVAVGTHEQAQKCFDDATTDELQPILRK